MLAQIKAFLVKFLYFLPYFLLAFILVSAVPFVASTMKNIIERVRVRMPGGNVAPAFIGLLALSIGCYFLTDSALSFGIPILAFCGMPNFLLGQEKIIELERRGDLMGPDTSAIFQAPLGYLYKRFDVFIVGNVVAGVAPPVLTADSENRFVARMELRNSKKTLQTMSGRMCRIVNEFEGRVAQDSIIPAPAVPDNIHSCTFHLECGDRFANPAMRRRTYLRGWAMTKIELEVFSGVLADVGALGFGGTLVWDNLAARVFALVEEVAPSERKKLDEINVLALRREWTQEAIAAGFAADHQYRTSNLNKDGGLLRLFGMQRTGVAPADVRADGILLNGHITCGDKAITPPQRPIFALQQQTTDTLGYNAVAGAFMLDCDQEGDHAGLPVPGSEDELSLRFTSAAAAGNALEIVQESLVAAGYDK